MVLFTEEQLQRYNRHIVLKELGREGQRKILDGKVVIIGVGGLGSAVAFYLGAAGIGTLGIIDPDVVDLTNLQRQILHSTADLQVPKVESAVKKLKALNPEVNVILHKTRIQADNITDIIEKYDFVIDATDNFAAKYLINDACFLSTKPYSHAGVLGFNGQTMTIIPPDSSCLRCVLPKVPSADDTADNAGNGILGSVAGMMGTIQATEALKYFTGVGELLVNKLLILDAADMSFRKINLKKNQACPLCSERPSITELKNEE